MSGGLVPESDEVDQKCIKLL